MQSIRQFRADADDCRSAQGLKDVVFLFPSLDILHKGLGDLLVIADAAVVSCLHLVVRLGVVVQTSQDDVLDVPELIRPLMLAPVQKADAICVCA
jgi:hypothetical protein